MSEKILIAGIIWGSGDQAQGRIRAREDMAARQAVCELEAMGREREENSGEAA